MKVYIRKFDEEGLTEFGEIKNLDEIEDIVKFINKSGGVVCYEDGENFLASYHLVLDNSKFFVEIILDDE